MGNISQIQLPSGDSFDINDSRIASQEAFSNVGSATSVPVITTNTLGQVINITEADIPLVTIDTNNTNVTKLHFVLEGTTLRITTE